MRSLLILALAACPLAAQLDLGVRKLTSIQTGNTVKTVVGPGSNSDGIVIAPSTGTGNNLSLGIDYAVSLKNGTGGDFLWALAQQVGYGTLALCDGSGAGGWDSHGCSIYLSSNGTVIEGGLYTGFAYWAYDGFNGTLRGQFLYDPNTTSVIAGSVNATDFNLQFNSVTALSLTSGVALFSTNVEPALTNTYILGNTGHAWAQTWTSELHMTGGIGNDISFVTDNVSNIGAASFRPALVYAHGLDADGILQIQSGGALNLDGGSTFTATTNLFFGADNTYDVGSSSNAAQSTYTYLSTVKSALALGSGADVSFGSDNTSDIGTSAQAGKNLYAYTHFAKDASGNSQDFMQASSGLFVIGSNCISGICSTQLNSNGSSYNFTVQSNGTLSMIGTSFTSQVSGVTDFFTGTFRINGTNAPNHTSTLPCSGSMVFTFGILTSTTGTC